MTQEQWLDELADFDALYRKTGNPLYAWWAIHLTVYTGRDMPDWCAEYLAECASRIISAAVDPELPASEKARRIPSMLQMGGQGKNCFRTFSSNAAAADTAQRLAAEKAKYGKVAATVRGQKSRSTIFERARRLPKLKSLAAGPNKPRR